MEHSREHIRFILSRGAGKGLANELISEILHHYPHATHTSVGASKKDAGTVTISLTRGPEDVATLAHEWDKWWGETGVVYIAGGDGSVSEVGNALAGKQCAFGVLPMGTGNDFARMLYSGNISKSYALSLVRPTLTPHFERIDALRVNDLYCVNVFSLGYDTEVLEQAIATKERYPSLGSLSYVAGVVRTAFKDKNTPLRIEYWPIGADESEPSLAQRALNKISSVTGIHQTNPVVVEQECSVMLVGNGQYYGSGYQPLPHARIDDSRANLLYVDALNLAQFGTLLGSYRKGTHITNPKVHLEDVSKIKVSRTDGEPLLWNVDGIVHSSPTVEVEILPSILTLARLESQQ